MHMDDYRLEWLRKQIYLALDLKDERVFHEFLANSDIPNSGFSNETLLTKFLGNHVEQNDPNTLFFYNIEAVEQVEEEIEIPVCKCSLNFPINIFLAYFIALADVKESNKDEITAGRSSEEGLFHETIVTQIEEQGAVASGKGREMIKITNEILKLMIVFCLIHYQMVVRHMLIKKLVVLRPTNFAQVPLSMLLKSL